MNNHGYLRFSALSSSDNGATYSGSGKFLDPRGITLAASVSTGWSAYIPTSVQGELQRYTVTSIDNRNLLNSTATYTLTFSDNGNPGGARAGVMIVPVAEVTTKGYGMFPTYDPGVVYDASPDNGSLLATLIAERKIITDKSTNLSGATFVHYSSSSDNEDGSIDYPYSSIESAITNASGSTIIVLPGSYNEIVTVARSGIEIIGLGRVMVNGQINIMSNDVSISGIECISPNSNPIGILAGAGNVKLDHLAVSRSDSDTGQVIVVSGSLSGDVLISSTTWIGQLLNSAMSSTVKIVDGAGSQASIWTISANSITRVSLADRIGYIHHQDGALFISNTKVVANSNGIAIQSEAANSATSCLSLSNVDLQQDDLTYGKINKIGTAKYVLNGVNRGVENDILSGTRVSFGEAAQDIYAAHTPKNYAVEADSVSAHLAGIDNALVNAGVQGSQGPQGYQGVAGVQGGTGSQGPQGSQGSSGIGAQGPQGDRGDTGSQGPQGYQGAAGSQGPQGSSGNQGPQGNGILVVADIGALHNINAEARYSGLSVYVVDEGKRYLLLGGTDNTNWISESYYGPDVLPPQLVRYAMVTTSGEEVYAYSSSSIYSNLTWVRTGTTLRIMRENHGLQIGDRVFVRNVNVDLFMQTVTSVDSNGKYFELATVDSGPVAGWKAAYGIGFNYSHNVAGPNKTSGALYRPSTAAGELYLHTLYIRPGASRSDTQYTVHFPSETLSSDIVESVSGTATNYILPTFQVRRVDGGIAPYVVVTVVDGNTLAIGGTDENLRINLHF